MEQEFFVVILHILNVGQNVRQNVIIHFETLFFFIFRHNSDELLATENSRFLFGNYEKHARQMSPRREMNTQEQG